MKYLKIMLTPIELPHWAIDLSFAIPRIMCGFFLACMFGGDKFGVPWAIADTNLGLFEVAEWFPKDVAEFGGIFAVAPGFFAWMGAGSEAIGGMFLLLGLFTRPASFLIACTMLIAIFFQKWGEGLWNMLPAMSFLWVAIYNLILGGGKWSLDNLMVKYTFRIKPGENAVISFTTIFLLALPMISFGQVHGTGNETEKTFALGEIDKLNLELNAEYQLLKSEKPYITISAEENMHPYIERIEKNGILTLDQLKWIEPSKPVKIIIALPRIMGINLSSWSEVKALELDEDLMTIEASVGRFILKGKVRKLQIKTGQCAIDASELLVQETSVKATGYTKLKLNVVDKADLDLDIKKVKLDWAGKPTVINGAYPGENTERVYNAYYDTRYINFVIKNNANNRYNFIVEGPKPDQTTFSYGFPMMPGQKRKKRWTVGTNIYKVNYDGSKILLCTIEENNEDQVVNLFK